MNRRLRRILEGIGGLGLICAPFLGCRDGVPFLVRDEYPQQHRLIALLGEARRTRPRFAGFAAGPCGSEARNPPRSWPMQCAEASPLKASKLRALSILRNQLTGPSPSTDHARGVWEAHLVTSTSGLYSALLSLQHATATNSAAAWNDLGAVHLLLYGRTGSVDELVSGLDSFERALDLDPRREEARFNRALALQILGLFGPGLTAEASPSRDRHNLGEALLADWARQGGKGPQAEQWLDRAVAVGAGDPLLLDSARFAQTARGAAREALVQAHALFAAARNGNDYASCTGPALGEAEQRFLRTGSPFGVWARIDLAVCDFFAKDFAAARRRLVSVLRETPPRYRIARARASWILGLVELRAGRLPVALGELRAASAAYSAAGESRHASYLESLIAQTLRHMGWRREGWIARGRALEGLRELDPERRYSVLAEVIETLDEEARFHAARPFLDAQLAAARAASRTRGASDLPVFAALHTWDLAWTAGDAGRAKQALEQAVLSLREVPPGAENRERLEREVALARSWMQDGDKDAALQDLLGFYDRHGEGEQLDALKHLQLRVAMDLARHERSHFRTHLEAALQRAEAIARWAVDPDQRRALQHRRRWLSARLVELESAVDGRRALLAMMRGSALAPGPFSGEQALARIRASLPPGAAVLIHFSVEQGTFGWLLDAGSLQSWRSPVGAFELGELATALRSAAVSADPETFRRIAERLGRALLPPSGLGHAGADLFIVTDAKTAGIAFSALVDSATGRSLLDDHAIAIQTQIGRLSSQWRNPAAIPSSVSVIAAPELDPAVFPTLTSLSFARQEGEKIAGLYHRSEKRIGVSVSMGMLEAAFHRSAVVHLATHARGPGEGTEAGLVLGFEGDGILGAADVERLGLRAPVVVLAACRSAVADEDPGSSSIAQAFLDAGSGAVVASLWPVDDRQSNIMFLQFHEELLQGKNPAQALRAAQLALRDRLGSSALGTWSAFQVLGDTEAPGRQ